MSVRKRRWKSKSGEIKEGWQADYVDAAGNRHRPTFARKKDAEAFLLKAKSEVRDGVHVADVDTITIEEAGKLWLKSGAAAGLERTTIDARRRHLELHIVPFIGDVKLNKTSVPWVRSFQDELLEAGRSPDMVKRVTVSLGSIFGDAQDRGLIVRNPVRERSRAKRSTTAESRGKARLIVGADIPSPAEIRALLNSAVGRSRPMLITMAFTGMRSSEIRALTWSAVDFDAKVIHVRQRADDYGDVGRPKSEAGDRSIPVPPLVMNVLREWRLVCPRTDTGRRDDAGEPIMELRWVFPNGKGHIESRSNIDKRIVRPAMVAAGLTGESGEVDGEGKPVLKAKYSAHSLRHFFASWCANPVSAGGLGLSIKATQERLGHASIELTMDRYSHLFPAEDHAEILAAAERALLG